MSILKKAIVVAAGAVASYYVTKYVQELLEQKPLKDRYLDAKSMVYDLKDAAVTKMQDTKDLVSTRAQALSDKVDSLIQTSDKSAE